MNLSEENTQWLLDSDLSLCWRVERDLLQLPAEQWQATRALVSREGFGAKLLTLQDEDGQWAGGAYFPGREEPRALSRDGDEKGQPYYATTWTLNDMRDLGVSADALGDTAERLAANSRWEYDDLPYWGGEVDCCINAFTLANGAWLGVDVAANAQWFLDHQLEDGGWNCEWIEGDTRSSFHSTLNSLIGLLDYETRVGADARITEARKRGEEYLLSRKLMYRMSTGEPVGAWLHDLAYPFRWSYSIIRVLNYFKDSAEFAGTQPDARASEAAAWLTAQANENGRWVTNDRLRGQVWLDIDTEIGEESKWLTYFAMRALTSFA